MMTTFHVEYLDRHVFAEKARQKKARGGSLSSGALEDSRPSQSDVNRRRKEVRSDTISRELIVAENKRE